MYRFDEDDREVVVDDHKQRPGREHLRQKGREGRADQVPAEHRSRDHDHGGRQEQGGGQDRQVADEQADLRPPDGRDAAQGAGGAVEAAARELLTINMGATAIGTGICAEPGYAEKSTAAIAKITGYKYILSDDLVGATSDTSSLAGYSSALRMIALKMNKICNDLRLLSSGPRCGLNEINLPPMQPGSSIMPGKVNPVIPEVMNQIAYKVIGNDRF